MLEKEMIELRGTGSWGEQPTWERADIGLGPY